MSDDTTSALLTSTQREYLEGKSVSRSYERNLRNGIQDRIEATMGDFAKLFFHLDETDVREAFGDMSGQRIGNNNQIQAMEEASSLEEIGENDVAEELSQPRSTIPNSVFTIAFLLRGLNYDNKDISEYIENTDKEQPALSEFIKTVESGIELYVKEEQNKFANVEVNIELSDIKPTYIEEK